MQGAIVLPQFHSYSHSSYSHFLCGLVAQKPHSASLIDRAAGRGSTSAAEYSDLPKFMYLGWQTAHPPARKPPFGVELSAKGNSLRRMLSRQSKYQSYW